MAESWRVLLICTIKPIADALSGAVRDLGHEPVALLAPRRAEGDEQPPFLQLTASSAARARPPLRPRQARDRAARARVRA